MSTNSPTQTFMRAFNRFAQPVDQSADIMQNIILLSSSSDANSVWFKKERILIDLGLSYKHYLEISPTFFKTIDYVFLTHEHSDHFNTATLKHVLKSEPHIKVLIPARMYQRINTPQWDTKKTNGIKSDVLSSAIDNKRIIVVSDPISLQSRSLQQLFYVPHVTTHGDITNVAIELKTDTYHILYATDLSQVTGTNDGFVDGLPNPTFTELFDIVCLEANYNTAILETYIDEQTRRLAFANNVMRDTENDAYKNVARARANLRHLSEEDSWQYASTHMKPDGIYIPLHASKEFGTLQQITIY